MLLVFPTVAAAAGAAAVVTTLTVSSIQNIYQTWDIVQKNRAFADDGDTTFTSGDITISNKISLHQWTTVDECLNELQSMNRKQLLKLFLQCQGPRSLEELEGDWNGCLLDNNSWVMTSVTSFLTHQLFGRGRKWNGKVFFPPNSNNNNNNNNNNHYDNTNRKNNIKNTINLLGANRFQPPPPSSSSPPSIRKLTTLPFVNQPWWPWRHPSGSRSSTSTSSSSSDMIRDVTRIHKNDNLIADDDPNSVSCCYYEHRFDASLQAASAFDEWQQPKSSTSSSSSSSCVRLSYEKYQSSPLSLWKTMMDEVRVIPLSTRSNTAANNKSVLGGDDDDDTVLRQPAVVLIGMGWMAWSGGKWNASPFCLWKS